MTNGEKYKTVEERTMAFRKFCANKMCKGHKADCVFSDKLHDKTKHMCEFAWLELEYEEALKPCPLCGSEARIVDLGDNQFKYYQVCCTKCQCKMDAHVGRHVAIAAWNRRV